MSAILELLSGSCRVALTEGSAHTSEVGGEPRPPATRQLRRRRAITPHRAAQQHATKPPNKPGYSTSPATQQARRPTRQPPNKPGSPRARGTDRTPHEAPTRHRPDTRRGTYGAPHEAPHEAPTGRPRAGRIRPAPKPIRRRS